jgi:hypothetical protein
MVQQLGEIAARIVGLGAQRKFEEALALVRQTEQELLGPLTATIDAVDAKTVRLLLGSDEKVGVWVVLLAERAKLLDAQGQDLAARQVARRALELFQLLDARGAAGSELVNAAGRSAQLLAVKAPVRTG